MDRLLRKREVMQIMFVAALSVFSLASPCAAGEAYCGIHCVYAAARLYDIPVDIKQLVVPKYIGSAKGSTMVELKQAATDSGLYAEVVSRLTIDDLRHCESQRIILHMKTELGRKEYDHYVLFVGVEDGKAVLLDPGESAQLVSFRELAVRWDGVGLVLSDKPIALYEVLWRGRVRVAGVMAIGVALILVLRAFKKRFVPQSAGVVRSLGISIAHGSGIVILALLGASLYQFCSDAGFFTYPEAVVSVQETNAGTFLPRVSKKEFAKAIADGAMIVDARRKGDYDAGHVGGAISIPVIARAEGYREAIARRDKDDRIVVYCQSARCTYATTVAIRLCDEGFRNVSIYRGGWNEWK